eukprot:11786387-Alexandrium_andersonii.AAC.1
MIGRWHDDLTPALANCQLLANDPPGGMPPQALCSFLHCGVLVASMAIRPAPCRGGTRPHGPPSTHTSGACRRQVSGPGSPKLCGPRVGGSGGDARGIQEALEQHRVHLLVVCCQGLAIT